MPLLTHGTDTMAVDTVMDMDLDTTDTDTVDTTDTTWARGPLMPNLRPMLMPLLMLGTDITDMDTDTVMAVTTVRKLATKHCYFLPTLLIDQPLFFKLSF